MTRSQQYYLNYYFFISSGIFILFFFAAFLLSWYWLAAIPFGLILFYLGLQRPQIIFFLLILALPWSVEYSFNTSLGTDLPDEPLMWLMTVLFVAYFLVNSPATLKNWRHPLIFLLFLYLFWILISILFSTEWLVSVKFFLAKTWYILAFVFTPLAIIKNKNAIRVMSCLFSLSMLCVVAIILFRHALLGFTFADVNKAVSPFFRNHVNYSAMLVCVVPVLIAMYRLNRRLRLLLIVAIVVVLAALFFSYARGAWLALVVGLISYWLISKQRLLIAFVITLVIIVGSVFWISSSDRYLNYANDYKTTIFHTDFREHLVATYRLKDLSTAERFNRWVAGVRMVKDKWLTGFGSNTFYNNYKAYSIPVFKTWVSDNKEHSTVHNYLLLVLIEQGIPGLVFFLLLAGTMLYYSQTLYAKIHDSFYKNIVMAVGVMLMMILTVNFLSDLIETDKVGSLFFLCLATLVITDMNTAKEVTGV